MKGLSGKTALITGGSLGIGYSVAASMLNENMNVIITGRDQQRLQSAQAELSKMGGNCLAVVSDVRELQSQMAAVDQALKSFGQLDVLVANAGVGHFAPIEDLTPEVWNETIDINLTGVFNSVKAALPSLIKSRGYIITMASLAGTNFFAQGCAYNASKFGLVGFTQALMLDVRNYGVKVTTIMPGSVATHFHNNIPDEKDHWKIQPEDIGQMVVDLLGMPARTLPSKIEVRPSIPK